MDPYQYWPLDGDLNEIRVLTLHPGAFSEDLEISIHKVALELDTPPIYEALSYVWGTTDNPVYIKVGPSGNGKLAITQNLAIALPYLRYENEFRTLWIDAICINQQDLRERSSQVKIMGDIYRLADRVVVWLGTEKDNSAQALKTLSQLASEVKFDYTYHTLSPASTDSTTHWSDKSKVLPYYGQELCNIDALLRRSWFSRLWVLQEIRLANCNATIMCGSDTVAWHSFRQAIWCLMFKLWPPSIPTLDEPGLRTRLQEVRNMSDSTSFGGVGHTIRRTASSKCSDPKDRIYAVLSMLDKTEKGINIEPDYTKTTAQVYKDCLLRDIEYHGTVEMLRFCDLQDGRSAEMPTWVPNWDVAPAATQFANAGFSCGHSVARIRYEGGDILSVTGVISATISNVEVTTLQEDYMAVINEIRRLAPPNIEDSPYVSGGSLTDAFVSTICANSFSDTMRPPLASLPQFEESRGLVLAAVQHKDLVPPNLEGTNSTRYIVQILIHAGKRSFFTTEEGYIGLAPKATRPGDQVCILLGSSRPLVLRPTARLQFQVVGECYIHGLANGEALLGPLPDSYRIIHLYGEGLMVFVDNQTGIVQHSDPRLKPSDWAAEDGNLCRFPDGSESMEVTPEMLKRRKVNVQTLDLV